MENISPDKSLPRLGLCLTGVNTHRGGHQPLLRAAAQGTRATRLAPDPAAPAGNRLPAALLHAELEGLLNTGFGPQGGALEKTASVAASAEGSSSNRVGREGSAGLTDWKVKCRRRGRSPGGFVLAHRRRCRCWLRCSQSPAGEAAAAAGRSPEPRWRRCRSASPESAAGRPGRHRQVLPSGARGAALP